MSDEADARRYRILRGLALEGVLIEALDANEMEDVDDEDEFDLQVDELALAGDDSGIFS